MSIIDDKTPIIFDRIDKIGSDFQKMFKTKFGLMKISTNPTISVNFSKFYIFTGSGRGGRGAVAVDFIPSVDRNRVTVKLTGT